MSWQATSWALETDLDPTSKIILIAYADFAGESGTSAWMFKKTLLTRVRRVSESTINRRMALLLEDGYLREGDQDAVPDYVRAMPPEARPIVYDMAMTEDARLAWKETYKPGPRRSAAAAAGAAGGRKSAALRQRGEDDGSPEGSTDLGGVSVTPPSGTSEYQQVTGGVTLTPPVGAADGGVSLQPRGLHSYDTPGVAQLCNPISTHEGRTNSPSRSGTASQPQNGPDAGKPPAAGQAPARRAKAERTVEQQAMWDTADEIARTWWDSWKSKGVTIVGAKFPGFHKSIVLAALEAGATPEQVRRALVSCGDVFPQIGKFQRALTEVQTGETRPGGRGRAPAAGRGQRDVPEAERTRLDALFAGSVNGRVIEHE